MGKNLEQEQECLRLESERVRHVKSKYDLNCFDEDSKRLLDIVLQTLNTQLAEIKSLIARYCPELRDDEPCGTSTAATGTNPEVPGPLARRRREEMANWLRWATGDKEALDRMLDTLYFTTNTHCSFATSEAERIRNDFLLRTRAIEAPDLAATMDPAQYPGIA